MGKLTTHVLDTANGRPGAGIKVELFALVGDTRRALKTTTTNDDGRCNEPLLEGAALVAGEYELVFHAGDYFAAAGAKVPEPRFVDRVVLRFGIADASSHYHVPLLVSPWSYSTYRGS
ncbi:hydroxyisourate hydrolase [Paraburkholderia phosphatilytica]|uniref:hydroxyisourate hydrolase n=1 Tax=Paraburkholderia phosphatilytica TaxID=2282883 RepID=UPI000E5170A9|nr:hydroxyisourate hydrolase [Paraburkholderia phosphatilytica]